MKTARYFRDQVLRKRIYIKTEWCEDPVSLAYNLFSLRADRVVYNTKENTLEAQGNVVMEDESGKHTADSVTFKIEDSQPRQLR